MAGYQQTIIVGNVGRDPNFKYTQGGIAVCDFSVAVTRRSGGRSNDQQGGGQSQQREEKTTWFRVTVWREQAEIANQYIRKGMQVMVVGTVDVNPYTDKSGQPAASLDLTAQTFQMLGSRSDNAGGGDYAPQGSSSAGGGYDSGSDNLSDIPF